MRIIGIETSSRLGSIALAEDDRLLSSYTFPEGPRHARNIMGGIQSVIAEAGMTKGDIDAVAVSQGPGGFTGLRIGVTCAKTLAYTLGWKAVGVPSLEVQVQNMDPSEAHHACPVQDARRDAVYGTVFESVDGAWQDRSGVLLLSPEELSDRLPEGATVFGTGVSAYPLIFAAPRFKTADAALAVPQARHVAALGLRMLAEGAAADPMELVPLYYRPTAAEENLKQS